MLLTLLFEKSITMGKEILIEFNDNQHILSESIGSETCVAGHIFQNGSSVYHTHLENNHPSVTDMINELFARYMFETKEHGVVTSNKIFRYSVGETLLREFTTVMHKAIAESHDYVKFRTESASKMMDIRDSLIKIDINNTKLLEAINDCIMFITYDYQKKYIENLRNKLTAVNTKFRSTNNEMSYIRSLKHIGINMRIENR